MWPNDLEFSEVLRSVGIEKSPFRSIGACIDSLDTISSDSLLNALVKVFHAPEASGETQLVLVWGLEKPYVHTDGLGKESTIVYIEKTSGSIRSRWPVRSLKNLANDVPVSCHLPLDNLRSLAISNRNWMFYKAIVDKYGPMRVWRAAVGDLNGSSGFSFAAARNWEQYLLCGYLRHHRCLPLKNRQT